MTRAEIVEYLEANVPADAKLWEYGELGIVVKNWLNQENNEPVFSMEVFSDS